jgi:hypothetical protein
MNDNSVTVLSKIAVLGGAVLLFFGLAEGPQRAAAGVTIPAAILIGSAIITLALVSVRSKG